MAEAPVSEAGQCEFKSRYAHCFQKENYSLVRVFLPFGEKRKERSRHWKKMPKTKAESERTKFYVKISFLNFIDMYVQNKVLAPWINTLLETALMILSYSRRTTQTNAAGGYRSFEAHNLNNWCKSKSPRPISDARKVYMPFTPESLVQVQAVPYYGAVV